MSGPVELIRAASARRAAQARYFAAAEHFASEEQRVIEQLVVGTGRTEEATMAHDYALIAIRAYLAETDDPRPKGLLDG